MFELRFSHEADGQLKKLKKDKGLAKRYKAVKKALIPLRAQVKLQQNPRHPSLQTHEFYSLKGPNGEKVFDAYAEQKTPAAYRIFFHYGPEKRAISIISIIPHP